MESNSSKPVVPGPGWMDGSLQLANEYSAPCSSSWHQVAVSALGRPDASQPTTVGGRPRPKFPCG